MRERERERERDIKFFFLIRIPEDILNQEFLQTRSVQILYRISGMLNESNHSHVSDGTSHALLHWHKWESSVPRYFCNRD